MNYHHHHHHHSKKQRIKGSITVKIHLSDHLHLKCISVTSYNGCGHHGAISSVMLISTRSSLVSLSTVTRQLLLATCFFSTLSSKLSQSDDAHFCSLTKGFSLGPTTRGSVQLEPNKQAKSIRLEHYKTHGSAVTGVPLEGSACY